MELGLVIEEGGDPDGAPERKPLVIKLADPNPWVIMELGFAIEDGEDPDENPPIIIFPKPNP